MDKVTPDNGSSIHEYHEAFEKMFPSSVASNERALMELHATAVDAWNVFPHKALDGKSPLDMVRAEMGKESGERDDREK